MVDAAMLKVKAEMEACVLRKDDGKKKTTMARARTMAIIVKVEVVQWLQRKSKLGQR